ncbi:MAG TPA: ABC transporter ATP-binding protein [Verrucomicrobiae bacterium]|nr:ABC transporter ATP-binding protein [Verrucomicrobiae bacterium]
MNTNAIEIRGLVKNYPAFKLGPLDLTVPRGAIYGLIGPNGAGKTTAIDLIFGMGKNDAGEIRVLGLDHRTNEVELKRRAAYVGPDLNFQVWGKVGKAIRFVRGFYPDWDDNYCAALMKEFHLSDTDKIATLSFGAKTKLSLLLALSRRPEVLILDEPTTGLDAVSKQQVFGELLKAVEGGERTVLISSHGLSDIERFADHVGMIKNGKLLLAGRMDEIVDRFRFAEFFSDNGVEFQNRNGFIILKHDENRWHALIDQTSDVQNWLQTRGAKEISLTRVTLEDLFVALAKDEEAK